MHETTSVWRRGFHLVPIVVAQMPTRGLYDGASQLHEYERRRPKRLNGRARVATTGGDSVIVNSKVEQVLGPTPDFPLEVGRKTRWD